MEHTHTHTQNNIYYIKAELQHIKHLIYDATLGLVYLFFSFSLPVSIVCYRFVGVFNTLLLFSAAIATHTHTHTLAFKRMRLLKLESYLNVRAVFCRGEFKHYIYKSKQDLNTKQAK